MSTELKWGEPPTRRAGNALVDYGLIARELRSRPGEWAMIGRLRRTLPSSIRAGLIVAFRPIGAWEARGVNNDDKHADVYLRFVGDPGAPA